MSCFVEEMDESQEMGVKAGWLSTLDASVTSSYSITILLCSIQLVIVSPLIQGLSTIVFPNASSHRASLLDVFASCSFIILYVQYIVCLHLDQEQQRNKKVRTASEQSLIVL